jgi:hypothetical protein
MPPTIEEKIWRGLVTNMSPHLLPPGAALVQNNLHVVQNGILRCRRGYIAIPWSGVTPADSQPVIEMAKFDRPERSYIVYQRADGSIKAAYNGGLLSISTGLHPQQPISSVRTRQGWWLAVNGIDRPQRWNGLTGSIGDAGIDPATVVPGVTLSGGGALLPGVYQWGYRWVDADGIPSVLSPITSKTATLNQKATVVCTCSTQARITTVELWRTTVGESTTFYRVATTANTGVTVSFVDTTSDQTLIDAALADPTLALPITNPDGSLNARRFVPPPNTKPFLAVFHDRLWFYGTVTYSTGTVSVTNGSATVTGTTTAWPATFVGRSIKVGTDGVTYKITAASATSLTLSTTYAGTTGSGKSYAIMPATSEYRLLYGSEQDEPESVPATNTWPVQENTQDNDPETGLMPFNSFLWLLHRRHLYRATFVSQGTIIVTVQLVSNRGCENNRLWTVTPFGAFLLDQQGAYSFDGSSPSPISEPIQGLWINRTLDFTKSSTWFCEYEPVERIIRFFVHYVGDSTTRPTRTLAYSVSTQSWATETFTGPFGAACRTDISGANRLILGGPADNLFLASEGLADGIATAVTGFSAAGPHSADTNTFTCTSAVQFETSYSGAVLLCTSGANAGLTTILDTIPFETQTPTFTPNLPNAIAIGDTFVVGGINYDYMTGRHRFVGTQDVAGIRSAILSYAETVNPAIVNFRQYLNHNPVAERWQPSMRRPTGVVYDGGGVNAVVNMLASQFPVGRDPGYKEIDFHGSIGGPQSPRWMAIELTGYQALDVIAFYGIELAGVQ